MMIGIVKMLHIVIYGIILMTSYVTGFEFRKKQANQFCHFAFSKRRFLYKGNFGITRSFWHLMATGLPLCSGSNKGKKAITHPGKEDCFHCQTSCKFGEPGTQIFKGNREIHKRYNISSLRIYSRWWIDKWRRDNALPILKWNIAMTVWQDENFLKSTKSYYLFDLLAKNLNLIKQ